MSRARDRYHNSRADCAWPMSDAQKRWTAKWLREAAARLEIVPVDGKPLPESDAALFNVVFKAGPNFKDAKETTWAK